MKNQNHTPILWKAHGRTIYAGKQIVSLAVSAYDAERAPKYTAADNLPTDDEGLANADFICRSVNCHEQLLEALKACITDDGAIAWSSAYHVGRRLEAVSNIARVAIAAAQGEKEVV